MTILNPRLKASNQKIVHVHSLSKSALYELYAQVKMRIRHGLTDNRARTNNIVYFLDYYLGGTSC